MEAIAAITADSLRLYPDPESVALKKAFADENDLVPEQVFIGNRLPAGAGGGRLQH
jgi:histidinol-phosphate aminotransferase